jgi:RNA polymerase sigma-70 factor (ECF subfamily)
VVPLSAGPDSAPPPIPLSMRANGAGSGPESGRQGEAPADTAPGIFDDETGPPPPQALSLQDQQMLSQLQRGNWAAMEQVVQRYQDRLYVTILRMVNHPEDAADLVQETFVRAMQGVARFEGKSTLYTWLFRIAVNLAISHRRASQYRAAASLDGAPGSREDRDGVNRQAAGLRVAQETESDPATTVQHRIDCERLLAALNRLDPEFRAVIVLRDVEECDYQQIAAILDVPVGTIKSRLFRARAALREMLQEAPGGNRRSVT